MARWRSVGGLMAAWFVLLPPLSAGEAASSRQQVAPAQPSPLRPVLNRYCIGCHSDRLRTAGLSLEALDTGHVAEGAEVWEEVLRKLRSGAMPPPGRPRPDRAVVEDVLAWLETELDGAAARDAEPGPDGQRPPAQSRRIPERGSRSAGAGRRCHVPAAGRQRGRARLRQHRRHAVGIADPAGPLSVGGAAAEPVGGGAPSGWSHDRGIPGLARSGRLPGRGPAVRLAGRRSHSPSFSGRWRVRHRRPPVPAAFRRGHRARLAARGRDPGGRRADPFHSRRRRGDRRGPAGRIRRRHLRESGLGAVRPERRRRTRGAAPGEGRLASRDRFLPGASDRGRGRRSPPAALPRA